MSSPRGGTRGEQKVNLYGWQSKGTYGCQLQYLVTLTHSEDLELHESKATHLSILAHEGFTVTAVLIVANYANGREVRLYSVTAISKKSLIHLCQDASLLHRQRITALHFNSGQGAKGPYD